MTALEAVRSAGQHAVWQDVAVAVHDGQLAGLLVQPVLRRKAAVVLAVLGASARHTSANHFLAEHFARAGLMALVVELLKEEEDERADPTAPDVPLLAERLAEAAQWLCSTHGGGHLALGLVGVGASGAAAVVAAATDPELAQAVVCSAAMLGRAGAAVVLTETPTLVLVGDGDAAAMSGCQRLMPRMRCERRLEVIRGAGHQLDKPDVLDDVWANATPWLSAQLARPPRQLS